MDTYQYRPIPINMYNTYHVYNTYKYISIHATTCPSFQHHKLKISSIFFCPHFPMMIVSDALSEGRATEIVYIEQMKLHMTNVFFKYAFQVWQVCELSEDKNFKDIKCTFAMLGFC